MLPADFEFPHALRSASQNPHLVHDGLFVKKVSSPDHLIEPAVSRMLSRVGIPHPPVTYAFRAGKHLLVAPHVQAKSLLQVTPEDAARIAVAPALSTLLAEHVIDVGDRHGGNYLLHGDGVVPIDFGYSLGHRNGHFGSGDSALLEFLRRYRGVQPSTPLPPGTRERLLDARRELIEHTRAGIVGLRPEARRTSMSLLLQRLRRLAADRKPTVAHFFG